MGSGSVNQNARTRFAMGQLTESLRGGFGASFKGVSGLIAGKGLLPNHPTILWLVAIGALGLDTALTVLGLHIGLIELNPLVEYSINHLGLFGLLPVKFLALLVGGLGWAAIPVGVRLLIPVLLAIPWLFSSIINLGLLLAV